MGEVLSQSEIDSLLAALSSGELDAETAMQEKEEKQGLFSFEVLRKGVEALVDKTLNEDKNESIK